MFGFGKVEYVVILFEMRLDALDFQLVGLDFHVDGPDVGWLVAGKHAASVGVEGRSQDSAHVTVGDFNEVVELLVPFQEEEIAHDRNHGQAVAALDGRLNFVLIC